jgi:hypothetical protein
LREVYISGDDIAFALLWTHKKSFKAGEMCHEPKNTADKYRDSN